MSLPFSLLDGTVALILQYLLRYRRRVIRQNLENAFRYSRPGEIRRDLRAYYRFLAKVIRQTLVGPTTRSLKKRMHYVHHPALDTWLAEGKSVLITFGHIGNWEWAGSHVGLVYPDQVCALYRKIKNPWVDRLMYNRRSMQVNYLVEVGQIGELLRLMKRKPILVLMLSDQNPGNDQGIIWAPFMGRQTAFVNGPESLALKYRLPVVYMNIQPLPKGHYELRCETIFNGSEPVETGEITRRFAMALEKNIRHSRIEWLWSHRRWKRKPEG